MDDSFQRKFSKYTWHGSMLLHVSPLLCAKSFFSPEVVTTNKSLKQVMTAPLPNARQEVWVSRVLRDDHYKPISRDTVGLAKNPSWPHKINDRVSSIGQNLQPFTGGYVSIYVKNSRVGQKTQDQQSIDIKCLILSKYYI